MSTRRLWTLTATAALFFWAGSASSEYVLCTKPSEPYCVSSYGDFDEWSFRQCRMEVEHYMRELKDFRECITREVQRLDMEAVQEANETIDRFNCKARGESFCL